MSLDKKFTEFSVQVYGNLDKYNDVLSKARVRIFYKGANRNGTYITDEFADKLISSLPYVPVKGIYDEEDEDFTDHGVRRNEGRIYGIVPENPNFAWETHLDEDGVERTYACADVLLFTALYGESFQISGKAQSMELYQNSLRGEFQIINGQKYFVFSDGCFLGLQALGDGVEPCFEGASFFSLYDSLTEMVRKLDAYNLNKDKGEQGMVINFKLSDNQKYNMIFDLVNPNFNEAGGWVVEEMIDQVYDEYAIGYLMNENKHERIYYTKNDDTDSLQIDKREDCYIVDVNGREKEVLSTVQKLNGNTFEKLDEKFENAEKVEKENSEFTQKITEQEATISTLTMEKENLSTELNTAKENYQALYSQKTELENQIKELNEYKLGKEREEKESVIDKYSTQLSKETLDQFKEKIDEYTKDDLDKELAYTLVTSKPSIFNLKAGENIIPKDTPKTGVEAILDKHMK